MQIHDCALCTTVQYIEYINEYLEDNTNTDKHIHAYSMYLVVLEGLALYVFYGIIEVVINAS